MKKSFKTMGPVALVLSVLGVWQRDRVATVVKTAAAKAKKATVARKGGKK